MPKSIADSWFAAVAVVADCAAAFAAVYAAVFLRFRSGWFPIPFGTPVFLYAGYWKVALTAAVFAYAALRSLRLYKRPQRGTFHARVPRLVRGAVEVTGALLVALALLRNFLETDFSAGVVLLFAVSFSVLLVAERAVLFRLEIRSARRALPTNRVLMVGTDSTAARLARCFAADPRLRVRVSGFLRTRPEETPDPGIDPSNVLGDATDFRTVLDRLPDIVQVIVTNPAGDAHLLYDMASECERRMLRFNVVPDLFRMLTSSVEVETIDDVPLLGLRRSPLDKLGNRLAKRAEDVVGALFGLILAAPVILVLALLVRRESKGPAFFRQTRCGYGNRPFTIYKLRSMRNDAEAETGAVFAAEDDPRRTRIGAFMRSHNLDELPQFWNVLKGDMSLVGPRPERPEFVAEFSRQIQHYMRRHVCRPGITGWAQVHGLRGNTSIEDRLHADLWYLENWSLALDFKILLRTLFAVRNAY